MIYFIRRTDTGRIKIGASARPGDRLKQLRMATGSDLSLLAVLRGGYEAERDLHGRFAHLRMDGEWFRPESDLAAFIRAEGRPWDGRNDPGPLTSAFRGDPEDQRRGEAIKTAREAKGLTRREAAEALSMTDQYLYQVETGRRRPTLETLWQIAVYLGLDPHLLDARLAPKPKGKSPKADS